MTLRSICVSGINSDQTFFAGTQKPLLFSRSTTTLPVKIMTPSFSGMATGSSCQCSRSSTDGVAPTHVAPLIAERVVLEEQMVFATEVDEAVWVICPVQAR